jgi:trans-aconitate 2-methyltransferase
MTSGSARPGYAFGDSTVARDRLDLLAEVFDPPSRAFLARCVTAPPRLAADLGCGPGNTTRMLREVTGARRVVGLDASGAFVRFAREQAGGDGLEFMRWEAGSPLPVDAPDLIYARLLLAHLPGPIEQAADWAGQLAPGGLLLLDELERIETDSDVLAGYLAIADGLVRARGAEMHAGPLLAGLALGAGCEVTGNEVVAHPVLPASAARMFLMNLSVWRDDPWVTERHGQAAIATMDGELRQIAAGGPAGGITWYLRQIVVRRTGLR